MTRGLTSALIVGLAWLLIVALSPAALSQERAASGEVTLIKGLDGGFYEPYSSELIETVQQALKRLGVYQGEVNGKLDEETMQAVGDFQQSHGLTVSGVPSPSTRKALFEP